MSTTRCDWARVGDGTRWHAFARVPGQNFNGETQLLRSACGIGPGVQPYSGMILGPSCSTCLDLTESPHDGVFTYLRAAP